MERRVVITAESAITPIGHGKKNIFSNLVNGVSGVKNIKKEDDLLAKYLHSKVFGIIDYEIAYDFSRKFTKTLGPVSYYACQVAKEVIEQADLDQELLSSGRVGIAFGSTHGSPTVQRNIYEAFFDPERKGYARINATDYLKSMAHTTAVNITRMFGITGRVIASCTACTTGSQSIGYGYEAIKYGLQDAMICGAADEYDTTTIAVFDNLLACSTAYNDRPHMTPRPFDVKRDGLVVGEGAGAVLLEEYEHARRRGATILAEVVGFSCSNNGGDLILPNADGVKRTIRMGLENARLNPGDVGFISAHATSTKVGDIVEAQAIHAEYGEGPLVTGLKSYIGHTMSSCGVIETIFTLYMLQEGVIVPTLNLEEIDPRCNMIQHVTSMKEMDVSIASIQNFAFGGVNTSLFIKKWI
ncbi:MAG TPA: beta-ketoacyl synthase N-terminal-like domain-containing protein [Spirochaetota bacterium]|nr:beta-ketoacyl synthase N-terminal-like domain-containing protein [Spirochaetota bacterium]HPC39482.1 beta-ketoacyl synthase N-terminal-like domain-containing protein [Spirochaetota bacterium]HPL16278.1 beta-ketoacyl synthase N-terminal-like domain-containing protein [Spirochaetota bacterium]HQF06819.1 beta-ketoacyl synthase N-terminal-like domain-containing protein [Spirochaetota bacterium]HQH95562.1 beta-ketoacyl synthase N-terminal-like domain-containing protein [Spirochaetota bacterium]